MEPVHDARTIARNLERVGAPVPDELAKTLAAQAATHAVAADDPVGDLERDLLAGDVDAATVAERITDAARRLTERDHANAVSNGLQRAFAILARRAAQTEGDTVVDALRGAFDAAVARLRDTIGVLGPEGNLDERMVLSMGAVAADAWHRRQAALRELAELRRARIALGRLGYGEEESVAWYVEGIADPAAFHRAAETMRAAQVPFLGLLVAGHVPTLLTASATDSVLAAVRKGRAAAVADQERRKREAVEERKAELRRQRELVEVGVGPDTKPKRAR